LRDGLGVQRVADNDAEAIPAGKRLWIAHKGGDFMALLSSLADQLAAGPARCSEDNDLHRGHPL